MKLDRGVITALITPFKNGLIDVDALSQNIQYQIEHKVHGLLVLGTTGEAPTLSLEEKKKVISCAVEKAQRKIPILVGTGSYNTEDTIQRTKEATDLGADIALIVTPYYNKPTQEGIFRHFEKIVANTSIPILVYNIQGRCGVNIETKTLQRIAALPRIIGVKEASGSVLQAADVIHQVSKLHPDFQVWAGDDGLTLPMMSLGAVGVISVMSNLLPHRMVQLVEAIQNQEYIIARKIHYELLALFKALFIETNPIPIKAAMNFFGMPAGDVRLPLCPMTQENLEVLQTCLEDYKRRGVL